MKLSILTVLMMLIFSGQLVQAQSKDTICVKKTHYKTLLEIATKENEYYYSIIEKDSIINKYTYTLDTLVKQYNIKSKQYNECLDTNYSIQKQHLSYRKTTTAKIKRKNKKLGVSYGLIGIWATYHGIRIYLILKP